MIDNKKCEIFISYRRSAGWELARLLYHHLRENQYNVFFDIEKLFKGKFDASIAQNLKECDVFILVLNRDALKRCVGKASNDWVKKEIKEAVNSKKLIIPVVDISNFKKPKGLPKFISDLCDKTKTPNLIEMCEDSFYIDILKLNKILQKHFMTNPSVQLQETKKIKSPLVSKKYFDFLKRQKNCAVVESNKVINNVDCLLWRNLDLLQINESKKPLQLLILSNNTGFYDFDFITKLISKSNYCTKKGESYFTKTLKKEELFVNFDGSKHNEDNDKISETIKNYEIKNLVKWDVTIIDPNPTNCEIKKLVFNNLNKNPLVKKTINSVTIKNIQIDSEEFGKYTKNNLEKYNFVFIDDLLSKYENPQLIINQAYKMMAKDSQIFVFEQDYKMSYCYPDNNGVINKFYEILYDPNWLGNTHTVREIYTYLYNSKFSSIRYFVIDKQPNFDEKFNDLLTRFKFDDWNKQKSYSKWLEEEKDKIYSEFKSPNLYCEDFYFFWAAWKEPKNIINLDEKTNGFLTVFLNFD